MERGELIYVFARNVAHKYANELVRKYRNVSEAGYTVLGVYGDKVLLGLAVMDTYGENIANRVYEVKLERDTRGVWRLVVQDMDGGEYRAGIEIVPGKEVWTINYFDGEKILDTETIPVPLGNVEEKASETAHRMAYMIDPADKMMSDALGELYVRVAEILKNTRFETDTCYRVVYGYENGAIVGKIYANTLCLMMHCTTHRLANALLKTYREKGLEVEAGKIRIIRFKHKITRMSIEAYMDVETDFTGRVEEVALNKKVYDILYRRMKREQITGEAEELARTVHDNIMGLLVLETDKVVDKITGV